MTLATSPPAADRDALVASVRGWVITLSYRYARRFGLDPEDVAQEATLRMLRSIHLHDPARGKASTWATLVVRSAARRLADLESRHAHAARLDWDADGEGDGTEHLQPIDHRERDPADAAQVRLDFAAVLAAADRLPTRQGASLRSVVAGSSTGAFAADSGIRADSARTSRRKAILELRKAFRE